MQICSKQLNQLQTLQDVQELRKGVKMAQIIIICRQHLSADWYNQYNIMLYHQRKCSVV